MKVKLVDVQTRMDPMSKPLFISLEPVPKWLVKNWISKVAMIFRIMGWFMMEISNWIMVNQEKHIVKVLGIGKYIQQDLAIAQFSIAWYFWYRHLLYIVIYGQKIIETWITWFFLATNIMLGEVLLYFMNFHLRKRFSWCWNTKCFGLGDIL